MNYSPNNELMLKTTVDVVHHAYQDQEASNGVLIGQSIGYQLKKFH